MGAQLYSGIHFHYMWMIRRVYGLCLAILFPPKCLGCGNKESSLCSSCIARSRKAVSVPRPYIIALFDFHEPVIRKAIHAIKYYHRRDLVQPLSAHLAHEMRTIPNISDYVLVPIPMPRIRQLLRGYNQAELIAEAVGKELSLPVRYDILKRVRSPERQVKTVSSAARKENQRGSFTANEKAAGLRIVLIDDVTTTGATLDEARTILSRKHARNVLAAALAH